MNTTTSRRAKFAVLSSLAIAAAVTVMAVLAPAQAPTTAAVTSMPAVATGETHNGLPVYRLPAVAVTASRSVELAKMEEEDRQALARTMGTPASNVGVATGETENGVPVYRLPKVAVTVSRSEELAKMIQEDKLAEAK